MYRQIRSLETVLGNIALQAEVMNKYPEIGESQENASLFFFLNEQLDQFFTGSIMEQLHVLEKNKQDSIGNFITQFFSSAG